MNKSGQRYGAVPDHDIDALGLDLGVPLQGILDPILNVGSLDARTDLD